MISRVTSPPISRSEINPSVHEEGKLLLVHLEAGFAAASAAAGAARRSNHQPRAAFARARGWASERPLDGGGGGAQLARLRQAGRSAALRHRRRGATGSAASLTARHCGEKGKGAGVINHPLRQVT